MLVIYTFQNMKSCTVTYIISILLAMVMILSPGFDVCAETYDSDAEIELAESISTASVLKNVEQYKVVENKPNGEISSIIRKYNFRRIIDFNIIPVDKQKIFCNFRE